MMIESFENGGDTKSKIYVDQIFEEVNDRIDLSNWEQDIAQNR